MPNEREVLVCGYDRYLKSKEAGDYTPPKNFAPLAKNQWYRWALLLEMIEELEQLDLTIARIQHTP